MTPDLAPEGGKSVDAADLVDRWMRAQLLLERQYFRAMGRNASRRERLLTLLEMDIITQLPEEGATSTAIASTHGVSTAEARLALNRLARRGMLERQRRGRVWVLVRTAAADNLIQLILGIQADLMASVLKRLNPDLQAGLLRLMESGAFGRDLVDDDSRSRP